jgi:hypothetical protein
MCPSRPIRNPVSTRGSSSFTRLILLRSHTLDWLVVSRLSCSAATVARLISVLYFIRKAIGIISVSFVCPHPFLHSAEWCITCIAYRYNMRVLCLLAFVILLNFNPLQLFANDAALIRSSYLMHYVTSKNIPSHVLVFLPTPDNPVKVHSPSIDTSCRLNV